MADLENERSVLGIDLFYHKLCLESYLQKYMWATAATKGPKTSSGKSSLFQSEVDVIRNLLQRGIGIPLSESDILSMTSTVLIQLLIKK